ncbi:MAG: toll/interleukin-1 receptor domain-containing protein [Candidatus Hodarchaeota archaeon]
MGVEDEIRELLQKGITPIDIINKHHYKKSTVYKINNEMKMREKPISEPEWIIENINLNKSRYQGGDRASISYQLRNISPMDLYVYRVGIELEWMRKENTWYIHGERFLLKTGDSKSLRGEFSIPIDCPLGEYDLIFGIEGQFLSPKMIGHSTSYQTQWSMPLILEVKRPTTGVKIFISHSTKNISLVRSLSMYLDNNGITPIIAEEIVVPGAYLPEKFKKLIIESDIFLALLTSEAIRSEWVISETNYALSINTPCILLKENSIDLQTSYEWIPFSIHDSEELITQKILIAIESVKKQFTKPIQLPFGGIVLVGLLAFFAGLAIGASTTSGKVTPSKI